MNRLFKACCCALLLSISLTAAAHARTTTPRQVITAFVHSCQREDPAAYCTIFSDGSYLMDQIRANATTEQRRWLSAGVIDTARKLRRYKESLITGFLRNQDWSFQLRLDWKSLHISDFTADKPESRNSLQHTRELEYDTYTLLQDKATHKSYVMQAFVSMIDSVHVTSINVIKIEAAKSIAAFRRPPPPHFTTGISESLGEVTYPDGFDAPRKDTVFAFRSYKGIVGGMPSRLRICYRVKQTDTVFVRAGYAPVAGTAAAQPLNTLDVWPIYRLGDGVKNQFWWLLINVQEVYGFILDPKTLNVAETLHLRREQ